jgi:hypothetical protein
MFSVYPSSDSQIEMDVTSFSLALFLNTVEGVKISHVPDWHTASNAISLAEQHQCEPAARTILYAACGEGIRSHNVEAFIVASRLDHVLAAGRLIPTAYYTEFCGGLTFRPNSSRWSAAVAARINPTWLWALTCAVENVGKKLKIEDELGWRKKEPWIDVLGEFMAHLSRCKRFNLIIIIKAG